MDALTLTALSSIAGAGICVGFGAIGPAIGIGIALALALRHPRQLGKRKQAKSKGVAKFLFVGIAMIESMAIFAFVLSVILLFTNPYWSFFMEKGGG